LFLRFVIIIIIVIVVVVIIIIQQFEDWVTCWLVPALCVI
jgi:hypothetical protein